MKEYEILCGSLRGWVDSESNDYGNLCIDGDRIRSTKKQGYAYLYSKYELKGHYKISYRFVSVNKGVGFGISDRRYSRNAIQNNYVYYHNDGRLFIECRVVKVCQKFKENDYVSICGDMNDGQFKIYVNQKMVVWGKYGKLGEGNVQWVPFVALQGGCQVCVLQTFNEISVLGVYLCEYWYNWDDDLLCEMNAICNFVEVYNESVLSNEMQQ